VLFGVLTNKRERRKRNLKGLLAPWLFLFYEKTKKLEHTSYAVEKKN